ncbi:MAG TPA: hypothetical protein VJY33_16225 [Isosphaeraceae bacterium]|nr:hypothetical protein [Isosphaeraceae bacterium]
MKRRFGGDLSELEEESLRPYPGARGGGREVDRIIGLQPKTEIMRRIERATN